MSEQNIFWSQNIKYLRNRKKPSQDQLVKNLDISHFRLNAQEDADIVNPALNDLLDFSRYFNISIDILLIVNLSTLPESEFRKLESGNDIYLTGSKIRILTMMMNCENKKEIEDLPQIRVGESLPGHNEI